MPAKPVIWGPALKAEYEALFKKCQILPARKSLADLWAKRIFANKSRYEAIGKPYGIPYWVIGCLHLMECGLRFDRHLHNGDPLTAKTKRVPAGRPLAPQPFKIVNGKTVMLPYSFEVSAVDALTKMGYTTAKDWSLGRVLYMFEGFNGYGYRQYHSHVLSPYLWSFTNLYTKGKYIDDGKWSENAVSEQLGIAAVMKQLEILGYLK